MSPLYLSLTFLTLFSLLLLLLRRRPPPSPPLPPGPLGLPILGSLPFLDLQLHSYFAKLARTHGPILSLRLGTKLAVIVTSPAIAREVLRDNDQIFANRAVPAAGRAATYGGFDISWMPYGPEWRMLRKVCVRELLAGKSLDSVYELRRREVRRTIGYLKDRAGSPVNVAEQMFLTMLNVITEMLWGGTVRGDDRGKVGAEFRQLVAELTALLGMPNVSDFFPALARWDLQGVLKRMRKCAGKLDNIFERVIDQRMIMAGDGSEERDFLQILLKLKDDADAIPPMTMVHVKALLMDMVVGGTDTTSSSVEFAMAEMMKHPEVMKKAQLELDSVIGHDRPVEESDIRKLPYLLMVLKETLRLHPVLPLLIPHCPSQPSTIGGYTIPEGSRVFINVSAIHRDPTIWADPSQFDPERFTRDGYDFSGNEFTYFPFGSGRRICAGMEMAERMFLFSLASLLHSFNWRLPEGEQLDVEEEFGIVMKKKTPLVVIPTPRLSKAALYE
ncbi:Flavonoid 3'-monooxygenase CYP75B137-like protein [Drosera capensis]